MPSDFSEYVDLTPYDVNPVDVYFGAIELARLTLPDFTLRQGTVDDAIFQAMSYMTTLNTAAINRLPPRIMEGVARILGVYRDEGTRASVTLRLFAGEFVDVYIPAGTTFSYTISVAGDDQSFTYENTDAIAILRGANQTETDPLHYVEVEVLSTLTGIHPLVPEGAEFVCQTVIPELGDVSALADFSNGTNAETDITYLARCTTAIRALSASFATTEQMRSHIVTQYSNVSQAKVYDLTNGDAGGGLDFVAPNAPGYASVFVYGIDRTLTNAELYDIQLDVTNRSIAGLYIGVYNYTPIEVSCTINIIYDVTYSADVVRETVQQEVQKYLSPAGFNGDIESIRVAEVSNVARSMPGVLYVEDVVIGDIAGNVAAGNIATETSGNVTFLRKGLIPNSASSNITVNLTASS